MINNIEKYKRGWLVGDFEPALIRNKDVEVALKYYEAGDVEEEHVHRIATEFTVVVDGVIEMNGKPYMVGEIIEVKPGEYNRFKSITNSCVLAIKTPSVIGDKYTK